MTKLGIKNKKIICSLGGGFSSSAQMPRILLENYEKENIEFINCVLPNEHADTWKLFDAVEEKLNISVTFIAYDPDVKYKIIEKQDRTNKDKLFTPFDIFLRKGFIGNSRNDPCSSLLKRETIFNYISDKYEPDNIIIAVGIHEDEFERSVAIRQNWEKKGYETLFPIINQKKLSQEEEIVKMKEWYNVSLTLYELGFEHNNCAGACIKAGQRQWARLWYYYPDVYKEWEDNEQLWNNQWAEIRGKQYTILKMKRGKKQIYISLKEFRENVLEPAYRNNDEKGFLVSYIRELPDNPPCLWCAAI